MAWDIPMPFRPQGHHSSARSADPKEVRVDRRHPSASTPHIPGRWMGGRDSGHKVHTSISLWYPHSGKVMFVTMWTLPSQTVVCELHDRDDHDEGVGPAGLGHTNTGECLLLSDSLSLSCVTLLPLRDSLCPETLLQRWSGSVREAAYRLVSRYMDRNPHLGSNRHRCCIISIASWRWCYKAPTLKSIVPSTVHNERYLESIIWFRRHSPKGVAQWQPAICSCRFC